MNEKTLKVIFYSHSYADEQCFDNLKKHEIFLNLAQTQDILIKVNEKILGSKIVRSWTLDECFDAIQCEKKQFIEKLTVSLGNKFLNGRVYYEPKDDGLVFDKIRGEMKNIILNLSNAEFDAVFSFLQKLYSPKKNYSLLKDFFMDVQEKTKNPDFKRVYCQMYRLDKVKKSCKYLPIIEMVEQEDKNEN